MKRLQYKMKWIEQPPRKALNKAFLKVKPSRSAIETFKTNLSRLIDKAHYTDVNVKPAYSVQLPIPNISFDSQKPFIDRVKTILSAKAQNQDTQALERELDQLVYELYGLTEAEIGIVEGK